MCNYNVSKCIKYAQLECEFVHRGGAIRIWVLAKPDVGLWVSGGLGS